MLREFLRKEFTPEERTLYMNDYIGWRALSDDTRKMEKVEHFNQAKFIRDRMKKIEGTVDYQQVINVRKAGIEQIKHQDGR